MTKSKVSINVIRTTLVGYVSSSLISLYNYIAVPDVVQFFFVVKIVLLVPDGKTIPTRISR